MALHGKWHVVILVIFAKYLQLFLLKYSSFSTAEFRYKELSKEMEKPIPQVKIQILSSN